MNNELYVGTVAVPGVLMCTDTEINFSDNVSTGVKGLCFNCAPSLAGFVDDSCEEVPSGGVAVGFGKLIESMDFSGGAVCSGCSAL